MLMCIHNDLGPIPKVPVNIIPSHQVRLTSPHKIYNAPDRLISLHKFKNKLSIYLFYETCMRRID